MPNYKQIFMRHMDREGVNYSDTREFAVRITYSGDNMNSIPVNVYFDEDGINYVNFVCWDIGNFKDKYAAAVLACNELNNQYRWVKFYVDDDYDVVCSMDAVIDEVSCGEECLNLVNRVVSIVDKAYPKFMRIRWSNDD